MNAQSYLRLFSERIPVQDPDSVLCVKKDLHGAYILKQLCNDNVTIITLLQNKSPSDGGISDLAKSMAQTYPVFHSHRYHRLAMSVSERSDANHRANKTKTKDRCCELYEHAAHGNNGHLKPALSWIVAKKLPPLAISGYICRGCRYEFRKVPLSKDTNRMSFFNDVCIDVMREFHAVKRLRCKVRKVLHRAMSYNILVKLTNIPN